MRLFPALLLVCLLAAAPASAQDGPEQGQEGDRVEAEATPWSGRTLGAVEVICDDPDLCGPEGQPLLQALVRLRPGEAVDPKEVAAAWSRLMRTDAFRELRPVFTPTPDGGVLLTFDGKGQVIITGVRVDYAEAASRWYPKQFADDIKKRLLLRKGGSYPVDDPDFIARQEANVLELYERQGYNGTVVRIEPRYEGEDHSRVEVVVHIREGDQDPIGQVLVQGHQARTYTEVLEPIDTGERVDFWEGLFHFVGIGTYERRRFREQLKQLEQQYRDEGWFAARVREEEPIRREGRVYPLVRIQEGPRVEVLFEGNTQIGDDVLRQGTTFATSGAIDDTEIEASRQGVISAYQAIGHYFVQVAARREKLERAGARQRIVFHVDEGQRVYVRQVRFEGNKRLSGERLAAAMETQGVGPGGVVTVLNVSAAVLQDNRMINDLTEIRALYRDRGYAGIRFRCMPEGHDPAVWEALGRLKPEEDVHHRLRGDFDVWSDDPATGRCFRVERTADARMVDVVVGLDEGPRTTVRNIEIKALIAKMPAEMQEEAYELLQSLGFMTPLRQWRRNVGLNRHQIVSMEGLLLRFYRSQGYTYARVEAHCEDVPDVARDEPLARPDPENPDTSCSETALYGRAVQRIRFRIDEGPKTVVAGILVRGNLETAEKTIRNELLFSEGKPLATDDLFQSQSNLRSLGIFESVKVETIGATEVEQTAPGVEGESPTVVKIDLEEATRYQIEGNLGLSVESSPLKTTEIPLLYLVGTTLRDRNLLGWGLEGAIKARHANRITAPTDIYGDDSRWSLGPALTDRRFLSTRVVAAAEATVQAGLTEQRDLYERRGDVTLTLSYDFYNLSYPKDWGQGLLASFKTTYGRTQFRDLTRRGEIPPFDDPVNNLAFEPVLTWDRRDNPLHPTRGWLTALSNEARFLSDELVPSLYKPAWKETLTAQYVRSFFDRRLILVPTLRLGAAQTRNVDDERLRDFLFKAGGDAVTHPVRGYADASIDACNGQFRRRGCSGAVDPTDERNLRTVGGSAYLGGSFEARFPTFVFEDFWFATFADLGAVAPTWTDMERDRLYPSVGGGLRWLITGQIPLRLDIGVPLRATSFSKREPRLHLNIFYQL